MQPTETWFVGDNVAWNQRYAAREALRAFVNSQERPKPMPCSMLQVEVDGQDPE
jgi:hypothetical protein